MLTEIKLLADIAKACKVPYWIVSYGIVVIATVSITITISTLYADKNRKIENVPVLEVKIDRLANKIDTVISINNQQHESFRDEMILLKSDIRNVSEVIRQKNKLDSAKFSKVLKDKDYFRLMDEWFLRLQNTMPYTRLEQKKNFQLTRLN